MDAWDKVLPLITLALGSFLTWLPGHFSTKRKEELEALSVEKALQAEVKAFTDMAKLFVFEDEIGKIISYLEEENAKTGTKDAKCENHLPMPYRYDKVYLSHIDKIGLLSPSMASDVVAFYAMANSFEEYMSERGPISQDGTIVDYEGAMRLLTDIMAKGESILSPRPQVNLLQKLGRRNA